MQASSHLKGSSRVRIPAMMLKSVICESVKVNSKWHWRCQEERADGQIEVSCGHKWCKLKESLCELQGLKLNLWALINPSAVISYHQVPRRYYTEISYLVIALLGFSLVWLNPALLFFSFLPFGNGMFALNHHFLLGLDF